MKRILASALSATALVILGIAAHPHELELGFQKEQPTITMDQATGSYVFRYVNLDGTPGQVVFVPATKVHPQVTASFSYDGQAGRTKYNYSISNGKASQQEISAFIVGAVNPTEVKSRIAPSRWHVLEPSPFSRWIFWSFSDGATFWHGVVRRRGLPQGQSQDGFSFESGELPGVVTAYFRGNAEGLLGSDGLPYTEELTYEVEEALKPYLGVENDSVQRRVIGPAIRITDLDPYDPAIHLNRLQSNLANFALPEMLADKNLRLDILGRLSQAGTALRIGLPGEAKTQLGVILQQLTYIPEANISRDLVKALVINLNYLFKRIQ